MKQYLTPTLALAGLIAIPALAAHYEITERGADYAVWTPIAVPTNSPGTPSQPPRGRYIALETGKHYKDESGQWRESVPALEVVPGGAICRTLPYKVRFGSDAGTPVQVSTPDNKNLKFRALGLAYYDFIARKYATFAEATNGVVGQLVSSNQVVYPGAIQGSGWICDLRYTVRKNGIEQDLVVRQVGSDALPESFQFNPVSTRILAITECLSPPDGVGAVEQVRRGWKKDRVARLIDFGVMKMGHGSAFRDSDEPRARHGLPVEKHLQIINGRTIILEEIKFSDCVPLIRELQASVGKSGVSGSRGELAAVTKTLSIPQVRLAAAKSDPRYMQIASVTRSQPGIVIDFNLESGTGITLRGDETYLIEGTINLTNAVIEGGSCVKFARGARLNFFTPPECRTKPYLPAVFTAIDDDSVGAILEESEGTPYGRYADTAIQLHMGGELKHVRIMYAKEAIYCASTGYSVRHAQILFCDRGLHTVSAGVNCENVLMNHVLTNFYGTHFAAEVQHLTSHQTSVLAWDPEFNYEAWCGGAPSSYVDLINSIVAGLTNGYGIPSVNRSYVHEYQTGDQVFVSAVGGHHYLREDSASRNAGSTYINPDLAADLRQRTVSPPIVLADVSVDTASTYSPRVPRGGPVPSLGFNYPALDYVFAGVDANANITFTPGTAVGWYKTTSGWYHAGHGIHIGDRQVLSFNGLAEAPCYWVRCNTVQELDTTGGYGPAGITGWAYPDPEDAPELHARFLRSYLINGDQCHFRDDWGYLTVRARDSEFAGAGGGVYCASLYLTNCLLERMYLSLTGGDVGTAWSLRSCTMIGERFWMNRSSEIPVSVRDCAFDNISFQMIDDYAYDSEVTDYSYNAYIAGQDTLVESVNSVIVQNSFGWQRGLLGDYYLPSSSPLINAGSISSAALAGLYHYTTQTSQTKEATGRIDVGFHRVATGSDGKPADTDGDTFPDYIEDANSNGQWDPSSGETDWQNPDSDYDGLTDSDEIANNTDPLDPDSFTPIRLAYFKFDQENWTGEQDQFPKAVCNVQQPQTWTGNGLQILSSVDSRLSYQDHEANGRPNINLRKGTIRFWFRPDWSSTTAGGTGPQKWSRLVEMGAYGSTYGNWTLDLNPDGTLIRFYTKATGGASQYILDNSIEWHQGTWYQITLTYGPQASRLYINGVLAKTASGVHYWPNLASRVPNGLMIGNDGSIAQPAKGTFDELETFNHELSATDILANYEALNPAPSITAHPLPQSITYGETASFSVVASGCSLSYQWRKNGIDIPGATSSSFIITTATVSESGSLFDVAVSCNQSSCLSSAATLTVNPAILNVTANDKIRCQGQPNPVLNGALTGIQLGDRISAEYSTPADSRSPQGTYPITPTWVDPDERLQNYVETRMPGTLTILEPFSALDSDHDGIPDDWEMSHFGNLSAGAEGDPDDDDLTNLLEYRAGTDPNDSDTDNDGQPDAHDSDNDGMADVWELEHFGSLQENAASDYDDDERSNKAEFDAGSDPNTVRFTTVFSDYITNQRGITATLQVLSGQPGFVSLLDVADDGLSAGQWTSWPSGNEIPITLENYEGKHQLWIATKGRSQSSTPSTRYSVIVLDTSPPAVQLQAMDTVSVPEATITGSAPEALGKIRFSISGEPYRAGYVRQSTSAFATFECPELRLAPGPNSLTVIITDLAGNSTTTQASITFDPDAQPQQQELSISWPPSAARVVRCPMMLFGQMPANVTRILVTSSDPDTKPAPGRLNAANSCYSATLAYPASPTTTYTVRAWDATGSLIGTVSSTVIWEDLSIDGNFSLRGAHYVVPRDIWDATVSAPGPEVISDVRVNGVQAVWDEATWKAEEIVVPAGCQPPLLVSFIGPSGPTFWMKNPWLPSIITWSKMSSDGTYGVDFPPEDFYEYTLRDNWEKDRLSNGGGTEIAKGAYYYRIRDATDLWFPHSSPIDFLEDPDFYYEANYDEWGREILSTRYISLDASEHWYITYEAFYSPGYEPWPLFGDHAAFGDKDETGSRDLKAATARDVRLPGLLSGNRYATYLFQVSAVHGNDFMWGGGSIYNHFRGWSEGDYIQASAGKFHLFGEPMYPDADAFTAYIIKRLPIAEPVDMTPEIKSDWYTLKALGPTRELVTDIDGDGNRDGTIENTDQDDIPEDWVPYGILVKYNNDDDDEDGQPDCDDGIINLEPGSNSPWLDAADLTPLVLRAVNVPQPYSLRLRLVCNQQSIRVFDGNDADAVAILGPNQSTYHLPLTGTRGPTQTALRTGDFSLYAESLAPAVGAQLLFELIGPEGEVIDHDMLNLFCLEIDLDIDSDNNDGFNPPNRSSHEDQIEDMSDKAGKILGINDDDSDADGVPDFADGFNWNSSDPADDTSANDRFVPVILELPGPVDLAVAHLQLTYDASTPAEVTHDGTPPIWRPSNSGSLRIWMKNADRARNMNSVKAASNPGDYVEPGDYENLSRLGFSSGSRTITLYIEGIQKSWSPGDKQISVAFDLDGSGPAGFERSDAVRVTLLPLDLDIDSDNNNQFGLPDRSEQEREVKYKQRENLPDEERVKYPGKVLMVNDGDVDDDGVPDFTDKVDIFVNDGVQFEGDDWPECPQFVPMVLHLQRPGTYDSMKVRFSYSASNPANTQKTSDGNGDFIYTPAPRHLRIWTKEANQSRKVAAINSGGDYVAPDINYAASALGFDELTDTVTLYVETVDVSTDISDLEIKVTSGWDPAGTGHADYPLISFVRPTSMNLSVMDVDGNNNITKAHHIETSQPTPVVTVNSVSVNQARPSANGQYIIGTLNLGGSVASAVGDITPISADKNIGEVLVYVNDSEDPIGTVSVTFTKTEAPGSFLRPFPYSGSFSGSLANVTLLEGVNVIRVVAKEPVDEMEGYAEYSFEVEAIPPMATPDGVIVSLDVQLTAALSPSTVDTITASLLVQGGGSAQNVTLTETDLNSHVFGDINGAFQIQITAGGDALNSGAMDQISAVASHTSLGLADLAFSVVPETGNDTKLFHSQAYVADTLLSLTVTLSGTLSPSVADTITASLVLLGGAGVQNVNLTETSAISRSFVDASGKFQIDLSSGGDTLDIDAIDQLTGVVSHSDLVISSISFSTIRETANNSRVFLEQLYWNVDGPQSYAGFAFTLSPISLVGASYGGLFKPYVLQLQGPDLFMEYLKEIELDDGPRKVEQSPIDGKYYVKMKNSPTMIAQFIAKRTQAGELNDQAVIGAMKDYANYNYGFAKGFCAGGYDMVEGTISLAKFVGVKAYDYSTPRIVWRMVHLDTFETERRFVRTSAETARRFAEVYAAVRQDQIVYLMALLNGTQPDPNDLSPFNIAMVDVAEVIAEMGKDLASDYANDPQKRGYYEGRAAFEILSVVLPYTKAGTLGKISKLQVLNELRARPMFSTLSGKGKAAFERLAVYLARLETTKMHPRLFLLFARLEREFPGETPWQTFKRVLDANPRGTGNIPARQWAEALEEIRDEMLHRVAQNQSPLTDLPSLTTLKNATTGRGIGVGPAARHVHHMVEKRFQRALRTIPESELNDVPGIVMSADQHRRVYGRLTTVIGNSVDPDVIIAGHRQVYKVEEGLNDLWEVTKKWFIDKGYTIPPE